MCYIVESLHIFDGVLLRIDLLLPWRTILIILYTKLVQYSFYIEIIVNLRI